MPAGLFLGFVTTWGEPSVRILADQVEEASNGSIRRTLVLYAICIGVAVWVGLGMLRIGYGVPILYLLVPGYLLAIVIMWLSDRDFVGIAVDAGGVATGPLANTFLLALALGTSASVGGHNPLVNGLPDRGRPRDLADGARYPDPPASTPIRSCVMPNVSLIVSIVRKGWGDTVLEASVKAGAHGGTILFGRGAGIH